MYEDKSPFNSPTYISIWNKHFNNSGPVFHFDQFSQITFIKRFYMIYVNVGKRITQGMHYSFNPDSDYEKSSSNVYLIYDVPTNHATERLKDSVFRVKKIKQYDGYGIDLKGYRNVSDYFDQQFLSKSKWNLNKSFKKLNSRFEIDKEVLFGPEVDYNKYAEILLKFHELQKKRYASKKESNFWLKSRYWEYLHELIFELIKERKAVIFIIYANKKPISIHINYLSPSSLILAYPVFDIDYSEFKVGHFSTYFSLQWCLKNDISFYDFSKGHFDYKKRWSNVNYSFNYHIIFNKTNFISSLLAHVLMWKYTVKKVLRVYDIDLIYHKARYRFLQ